MPAPNRAFAGLDADKAAELEADIFGLLERSNQRRAGSLVIPGAYLGVVVTRRS